MDYKSMKIEDIIKWCQENNEVEWLKKTASQKTKCEVYPRMKVVNEKGKTVSVADKSKEPKIEERPISFIEIKKAFAEKFMPEIAPAKAKKPSMYDLIASL